MLSKTQTELVHTIMGRGKGVAHLEGSSQRGNRTLSLVKQRFHLYKDGDIAAQEVRDKIATILSRLPVGTDPPLIDKFDIDAAPVATIAISGGRNFREVTEIAREQIKENLETVQGVGAVTLVGGQQRAVNIFVDTDKLAAYMLSAEDVRQALIRQNIELPGGRVDEGQQELVLRTMGRIEKSTDFLDLIVADRKDQPIRIRDIGRVEDGVEEPRGAVEDRQASTIASVARRPRRRRRRVIERGERASRPAHLQAACVEFAERLRACNLMHEM